MLCIFVRSIPSMEWGNTSGSTRTESRAQVCCDAGQLSLGWSLSESVMVGDRCSDVGAANAAGLRQAFLISGTETGGCGGDYLAVKSLAEVERWLVERG